MSGVYVIKGRRLVCATADEEATVVAAKLRLSAPAEFYRSLGFLYKSGYSLARSFKLLGGGMETQEERVMCLNLFAEVRKGRSLVESFRACGFPPTLVSALEAGEVSGNLEGALFWYAEFEERNQEIRRQLKQAVFYPAITLGFTLLLSVLLPPLVLKDQLTVLAQSGTELPFLSKLLFWFSQAVTHPLMLLVPIAGWLALRAAKHRLRTREGRRQFERVLLSIPLLGEALRRAAGARALALLALIIKSGGPPTNALIVAGDGSGSEILRDRLQRAVKGLVNGQTFCECLKETEWFTASTEHLIEAGEAVGDPSPMIALSSELEEDALRESLQIFASALQPMVMLLVGILVCLTIIAVLGPSLSLISNL